MKRKFTPGYENVWIYVYESLKHGGYPSATWTMISIKVLPSGEKEVILEEGEEVMLMLEVLDADRGHFILYHRAEERPQKYPVTLKNEVLGLLDPSQKERQTRYEDCTVMDFEGDEFFYCTYDNEALKFYVPPSFTLERLKQEMLKHVSEDYYDDHFDLLSVYDSAGVNGAARPSGQTIEYEFKLGDYEFKYGSGARVRSDDNIYLRFTPPKEIMGLAVTPSELDDLIYTCLDENTYYTVTNRAVKNHSIYGFSPYVSGEGPPRVRDMNREIIQEVENRFAVWLEEGEVDCFERDERALLPVEEKEIFLLDASEYIQERWIEVEEEEKNEIWVPIAVIAASSAVGVTIIWYLKNRRE